jgi:hypothetical protein
MSVTLSPSGLKVTSAFGESGWATLYNYNWQLLNDTLLKLSGLQDVEITGLADGDVIVWSAAKGKFVNYPPPGVATWCGTTTSTTSSSSTSSSTSSSSTTMTTVTQSTASTVTVTPPPPEGP